MATPTPTLRWYLIRHGVTAWNRELRMQGHTDVALGPEGLEQAERIGERVASLPYPPTTVWSSDLSRARVTAEAIASRLGLEVRTTPLLRETMLGDWEGLTAAEIEARGDGELLKLYIQDSYRNRPPNGETMDAAWERMTCAAQMIREAQPEGNVAVVGHGGSIRALILQALEAPVASMRRMYVNNCSLSVVEEFGSPPDSTQRLLLFNDISHLG